MPIYQQPQVSVFTAHGTIIVSQKEKQQWLITVFALYGVWSFLRTLHYYAQLPEGTSKRIAKRIPNDITLYSPALPEWAYSIPILGHIAPYIDKITNLLPASVTIPILDIRFVIPYIDNLVSIIPGARERIRATAQDHVIALVRPVIALESQRVGLPEHGLPLDAVLDHVNLITKRDIVSENAFGRDLVQSGDQKVREGILKIMQMFDKSAFSPLEYPSLRYMENAIIASLCKLVGLQQSHDPHLINNRIPKGEFDNFFKKDQKDIIGQSTNTKTTTKGLQNVPNATAPESAGAELLRLKRSGQINNEEANIADPTFVVACRPLDRLEIANLEYDASIAPKLEEFKPPPSAAKWGRSIYVPPPGSTPAPTGPPVPKKDKGGKEIKDVKDDKDGKKVSDKTSSSGEKDHDNDESKGSAKRKPLAKDPSVPPHREYTTQNKYKAQGATPMDGCGSIMNGDFEAYVSILKVYRDFYKSVFDDIISPEVVLSSGSHPAWGQAAEMLGLKLVYVPIKRFMKGWFVESEKYKQAITPRTILLILSPCTAAHGIMEPIFEVSLLAKRYRLPIHIDGNYGGFFLAMLGALQRARPTLFQSQVYIPVWDFSVDQVMSMSLNLSREGFGPKVGSTVILYRNHELRKYQFYSNIDTSHGIYLSSTITSPPPGTGIAGTWASLQLYGANGYLDLTQKTIEGKLEMAKAILTSIPHLELIGTPLGPTLSLTVAPQFRDSLSVLSVLDALELNRMVFDDGTIYYPHRAWVVKRQWNPDSFSLTFSPTDNDLVELNEVQSEQFRRMELKIGTLGEPDYGMRLNKAWDNSPNALNDGNNVNGDTTTTSTKNTETNNGNGNTTNTTTTTTSSDSPNNSTTTTSTNNPNSNEPTNDNNNTSPDNNNINNQDDNNNNNNSLKEPIKCTKIELFLYDLTKAIQFALHKHESLSNRGSAALFNLVSKINLSHGGLARDFFVNFQSELLLPDTRPMYISPSRSPLAYAFDPEGQRTHRLEMKRFKEEEEEAKAANNAQKDDNSTHSTSTTPPNGANSITSATTPKNNGSSTEVEGKKDDGNSTGNATTTTTTGNNSNAATTSKAGPVGRTGGKFGALPRG